MNDHGNVRRARMLFELVDFASRASGRSHARSESLRMERHVANLCIDGRYCSHMYVATFEAGELND